MGYVRISEVLTNNVMVANGGYLEDVGLFIAITSGIELNRIRFLVINLWDGLGVILSYLGHVEGF